MKVCLDSQILTKPHLSEVALWKDSSYQAQIIKKDIWTGFENATAGLDSMESDQWL